MDKNLGLTEEQFDEMVHQLKAGDEQLFELTYKNLVVQTIQFLQKKYRINKVDAKESTIIALYTLRKMFLKDKVKYSNIRFLFSKMAYQEYLRLSKHKSKYVELTKYNTAPSAHREEEENIIDKQFRIMNIAMKQLNTSCVELLEEICNQTVKLYEVADRLGIAPDLLRKRKQRCIDKLKVIIKGLPSEITS